jgi:ankyrin repeat protein
MTANSAQASNDPMAQFAKAVMADDVRGVTELLAQHPELKSRLNDALPDGSFGQTALIAAVQRTNRAMIDLLLASGADINGKSHWWAGGFGVMDDDRGLASWLMERGATLTPHAAARLGMLDRLAEMIGRDPALVHSRGGDGQTPLHFAKNVETAKLLLEYGADINARDVDHESTAAQYMLRERADVARYLVSRGCKTDLLMASALGDIDLVRKFLDADPSSIRMMVNDEWFPKQNPRAGGTIYYWALHPNCTAHLAAREFGHEDVLRLLLERSPEELKLAIACELGDEELFRQMLARRPEMARKLPQTEARKLSIAAQGNNAKAVKLMLSAGWPVDGRGDMNATALHWASWHGNADIVRELLRYQAPVNVRGDRYNLPPLGWAAHGSMNSWHRKTGDYAAVVEALLNAGANPADVPTTLQGSDAVETVLRRQRENCAGGM